MCRGGGVCCGGGVFSHVTTVCFNDRFRELTRFVRELGLGKRIRFVHTIVKVNQTRMGGIVDCSGISGIFGRTILRSS